MPSSYPHHIIAIGASAGGLDEIITFFDNTAIDGVSYVIVQHLASDFKSRMLELLAGHSKLMVTEAADGMLVEPNKVYLIPNDKIMTIKGNQLCLAEKLKSKPPHLTINTFFKSLAADHGSKAIAVVLSGMGADGSEGVKEIKKAGGLVIVRNPENSEFPSMPLHAIETGNVDIITEPDLMPLKIAEFLIRDKETLLTVAKNDEIHLKAIMDIVSSHSPHDFSDYKPSTIIRRINRRASENNFLTIENYIGILKDNPQEIEALTKEFLISVTSFFRDKKAFQVLEKEIIPDILKKLEQNEELKLWVAGCATGEEAYTLAILISEQLQKEKKARVVKIFATDIDSAALIYAANGIYNKSITKDVSPERLEKYFTKEKDKYKIKSEIRRMVIFANHDIVRNPPYCNMHFISCRNVLIYMTPVLQKKIFLMLLFGLKKDGYLFLGSSENPLPIIESLDVINKKYKIYKNRASKSFVRFDAFSLPVLLANNQNKPLVSPKEVVADGSHTLDQIVNEAIISYLDKLVVCIDDKGQVIRAYGNTDKYLLPKVFNSNFVELLPKPLAIAFNVQLASAKKTGKASSVKGVIIKKGAAVLSVNLTVKPLAYKQEYRKFFMVAVSDDAVVDKDLEQMEAFNLSNYQVEYTANLESEVRELKEKLEYTYLQLDATNENMQSFNEELLSANEEMQSTNEEMQSVNEELHTINSDYQLKNKELLELNDDLNNYFRSNVNGQLFVNKDLILMRFSPGTVKQINLLPTDVGRPLSNISTNIKFETITEDIKKVIKDGSIITKDIQTENGKWYQIMTMPYLKGLDNVLDGAIITFNDITHLKTIEQRLENSNKMLFVATEAAEMGTWHKDIKTREFIPSKRYKEIYGYEHDKDITYEQTVAQVEPDFQPLIIEAEKETLSYGKKYEIEYKIRKANDQSIRWVRSIGNIIHDIEGRPAFLTGILQDITEQKQDDLRKNDFIAIVSHELKTPLTTLKAYLQILQLPPGHLKDGFFSEALEMSLRQVNKMNKLIQSFLDVARLEAGKIHLNITSFDFKDLMSEIEKETQFTLGNYNIIFHETPSITVTADKEKIGQVISNLISNAVKYSSGTKIEISCSASEQEMKVCVKDEGIGIEEKHISKLFERFYRIENKNSQTISGFGIGLYLCSEIVHRHKGRIWVESEMGKGSSFFFTLPL